MKKKLSLTDIVKTLSEDELVATRGGFRYTPGGCGVQGGDCAPEPNSSCNSGGCSYYWTSPYDAACRCNF